MRTAGYLVLDLYGLLRRAWRRWLCHLHGHDLSWWATGTELGPLQRFCWRCRTWRDA